MKRIKIISVTLVLLLMISITCYAAIDSTIHFDVKYEGEVKVNEEKNTVIILAGENTPVHSNVRVKVNIEGPAKPKLMATDSNGNQINIAETGYWGPEAGFAIAGTFKNETPVKATFTEAGNYTIKLSLLDVQNGNNVLAEKSITIQVKGNEPVNEVVNEPVEELPQTGTSLLEYTIYAAILLVVIYLGYQIRERRK